MGALPLNARVAHFRLIFWWRESGITRVRAGKVDSAHFYGRGAGVWVLACVFHALLRGM